jgi:AraC-like DNA-binding protein
VSYGILAIRFRPGGLYSLLGIPLDQFTDEIADLADYKPFDTWIDQLAGQPDLDRRLQCLNSLLLSHVDRDRKITVIQYALKKIYNHQGYFRVTSLAKETGLSQRQIERQFKTVVGLSPKQIARIVQFQNMIGMLKSKGEDSLLHLATDGGYSDHAHFTKSFKEFSGITPQEFLHAH